MIVSSRIKKLHPIESDIITLARQLGKVTNQMVVSAYGHNPNTVKARFENLVRAGMLKAHWRGKVATTSWPGSQNDFFVGSAGINVGSFGTSAKFCFGRPACRRQGKIGRGKINNLA